MSDLATVTPSDAAPEAAPEDQDAPKPPTRADAASYVRAIFDREMGVTLHNVKVGSPRDAAMRELTKTTTNLYAKRVLRELIQNAFDGAADDVSPRLLVRLNLREGEHGTLYVANNGSGFTTSNIDAIANPAMSNKRPGNFIGHKGLGFRSVELLSNDTQIYSMGTLPQGDDFNGYCFRFAHPADELKWLEDADAVQFADTVVGRTHRLQLPIPIDVDPVDIRPFAVMGFATVVRLPLTDALAAERALEEFLALRGEQAPITLFLDRLSSLTLECIAFDGSIDRKVLTRHSKNLRLSPRARDMTLEEVTVDRKRYMIGRMTVDEPRFRASIERAVERKHPVEKWREWNGAPTISIALPIGADARAGQFYAFLPMDTVSPFNGSLDAPFFPNADRRDLDLTNPLNSFLLDSIADLCIAVPETIADGNESSTDMACVAVDALAWTNNHNRLFEACTRASLDIGEIRLPAVRRTTTTDRWATIKDIYDWQDDKYQIIDAAWLVRACNVPMLRRSLGEKRLAALLAFVNETDYTLEPAALNWRIWAPLLADDLVRRKKTTRLDWDRFYADLSQMHAALPHLQGQRIFRQEDGTLAAANAPTTLEQSELFISPNPDHALRSRKRLAGTSLFPPASVARKMVFADPTLAWPSAVTKALFAAGLATEYSLPKVISGMGRLLGKRPNRQAAIGALGWAFSAWKSHKSTDLEKALRAAAMPVPLALGGIRAAPSARFGRGWRETRGDLLADFCAAAPKMSRAVRILEESLIPPWEDWPLRERGTSTDWADFLRLLGVRDRLLPVYFKSISLGCYEWWAVREPAAKPLPIEASLGPQWRAALQSKSPHSGFGYVSGSYATDESLVAFPHQGEYASMSESARMAYARILMTSIPELPASHLATILRRTAGNADSVRWPSPLLAFLKEAEWIPVSEGEHIRWVRPSICWFAPRAEPLPRFLPRIERSIREFLEVSGSTREFFRQNLGIRLWNDRSSAVARLVTLGDVINAGIVEADHDAFRKAYRHAWQDWHASDPRGPIPANLILAVQLAGRLTACPRGAAAEDSRLVFVGDGVDPTRENLLMALGHRLLSVPDGAGPAVQAALHTPDGPDFQLVATALPTITLDGVVLDETSEFPLLAGEGREWLAEIAVLVLEFNVAFANRNTLRTRQALYDAFRRIRVTFARHVTVEVGGRTGTLPGELDGVLAVPDADRPTVVVQSAADALDWPTMARLARGVALAIERPWLLTDFRMAFLAIASAQPALPGVLERPSDEAVAQALGQPLERLREVYRSLRATSRRLFEWLIPVVHLRLGPAAASFLIEREATISDDADLIAAMVRFGSDATAALQLLTLCRDAISLDELRRELGIDLGSFNETLRALGLPWKPLGFEEQLRRAFEARKAERRSHLEQTVRDAYLATYDARQPLVSYNAVRSLDWVSFDGNWIADRDELSEADIDAHIAHLVATELPAPVGLADGALDVVRQHNRSLLLRSVERLRQVIAAWAAKNPAQRNAGTFWNNKADQIARDAIASGVMDFRTLDEAALPSVLQRAWFWPTGMPPSVDLPTLGLTADDLEHQARKEQQLHTAELQRRRSMTFGDTTVDGGAEGSMQAVADALRDALGAKAFLARSGRAKLREFPGSDAPSQPARRGAAGRGKDPAYLSQEQRDLIGFAGELAAYEYLKKRVRNFADEHWISSMGRRFLGLPPGRDDEGFDFHVTRSRGDLYFEVKAHVYDPGYVDLERSQVASAVAFADERKGIWTILYVANVLDPNAITVFELQNPFSQAARNFYRPSHRQGIRLLLDRV